MYTRYRAIEKVKIDKTGKSPRWKLIVSADEPNPDYMSKEEAMRRWGEDRRTTAQKRKTRKRESATTYNGAPISKSKALVLAAEYMDECNRGTGMAPAKVPTFGSYLETFLGEYGRRVEASTMKVYGHLASRLREASFASMPMDMVTNAHIKAWLRELDETDLAQSSKRKHYQLLHKVFDYAVECDIIKDMPFKKHDTPKMADPDPNVLTESSLERLMAMLGGMEPTPLVTAVYIALYTGMRQGEICALQWRDIDLDDDSITVSKAIARADGHYVKEPKTKASRRAIPFDEGLEGPLLARMDAMRKEISLSGSRFESESFGRLYTIGSIDGAFKSPMVISKEWSSLARSFNLMGSKDRICTFHDLRHTYITELVKKGADIKTVSSLAGHSNAAMTLNIYADADPKAKRQAVIGLYGR